MVPRTIVFAPVVMSMVAVSLPWSMIHHPLFALIPAGARNIGPELPAGGFPGDPATVNWAILAAACWQYTGFIMVITPAGMQAIPPKSSVRPPDVAAHAA